MGMSADDPQTSSSPPGALAIAEDHLRLSADLQQMEAAIARPHDAEGWLGALADLLDRLQEDLRAHFALEERDDLYRKVPSQVPRFAERLACLEKEHGEILGALDEIRAKERALVEPGAEALRGHAEAILAVIAKLRRHESLETEILLRIDWEDLGRGD